MSLLSCIGAHFIDKLQISTKEIWMSLFLGPLIVVWSAQRSWQRAITASSYYKSYPCNNLLTPDQTRPDQTRLDQTRPDQTRPLEKKFTKNVYNRIFVITRIFVNLNFFKPEFCLTSIFFSPLYIFHQNLLFTKNVLLYNFSLQFLFFSLEFLYIYIYFFFK